MRGSRHLGLDLSILKNFPHTVSGGGGPSLPTNEDVLALSPWLMFDTTNPDYLATDGTHTTNVSTDGDLIGSMEDLGSSGAYVEQATAANKPRFTDDGSFTGVFQDGLDDFFYMNGVSIPAGYTILVGIDLTQDTSTQDGMLLYQGTSSWVGAWNDTTSTAFVSGNFAGSSYSVRINGVAHSLTTRAALRSALIAAGPCVLSWSTTGNSAFTIATGARLLNFSTSAHAVGGPIYGYLGMPLLTGADLDLAEAWVAGKGGFTL